MFTLVRLHTPGRLPLLSACHSSSLHLLLLCPHPLLLTLNLPSSLPILSPICLCHTRHTPLSGFKRHCLELTGFWLVTLTCFSTAAAPPCRITCMLTVRYEEALVAFDKLLACDPNWYSWTSYVNVMAVYPFVLLGAKGPEVRWCTVKARIYVVLCRAAPCCAVLSCGCWDPR